MLLSSLGSTFSQGSFKLQGSTESKVITGLQVLTLRFRDLKKLIPSAGCLDPKCRNASDAETTLLWFNQLGLGSEIFSLYKF